MPIAAHKIESSFFMTDSHTHESVLLRETIDALDLHDGGTVIDATAGMGGHSEAILETAHVRLIALDADPSSVAATKQRLERFGDRVQVIEANFRDLTAVLRGVGVSSVDRVLFDLGWNRNQLSGGKGFSFQLNEPLTMTYGREPVSGFTAAAILNTWSEEAIGNVLYGYGGERYARRIAKNVAEARVDAPIETTAQFVAIIERSVPAGYRHGKTHVATKSFQGLRIAVNDELGSTERGLRAAWEMLASKGRISVITFNSLEDRLVKKVFAEFTEAGMRAHKKPIVPSREEVVRNRAARSAKLRTIIKN